MSRRIKLPIILLRERFDDILAESESITDKTIKIISGFLVFTGFTLPLYYLAKRI